MRKILMTTEKLNQIADEYKNARRKDKKSVLKKHSISRVTLWRHLNQY